MPGRRSPTDARPGASAKADAGRAAHVTEQPRRLGRRVGRRTRGGMVPAEIAGRVGWLPHETPPRVPLTMQTIAALYIDPRGPYPTMAGVDPWDVTRDARTYAGPHPVVAHPPCERWGRYWGGGPSVRVKRQLGDDNGCFAAALASVRAWGGVLEHPEGSHAFRAFGLALPKWRQGWIPAGDGAGFVCCVAQGNYGHRSRKLTWLYAVRCDLPELDWSIPPPAATKLDHGFHSAEERRVKCGAFSRPPRMSAFERRASPPAFAEVLAAMARSVR
jgi:hypothetical protein